MLIHLISSYMLGDNLCHLGMSVPESVAKDNGGVKFTI